MCTCVHGQHAKQTNIETKMTDREAGRQAETDKQTDRQTDKQTNRETDRQTDRQTDKGAPGFLKLHNLSQSLHQTLLDHDLVQPRGGHHSSVEVLAAEGMAESVEEGRGRGSMWEA